MNKKLIKFIILFTVLIVLISGFLYGWYLLKTPLDKDALQQEFTVFVGDSVFDIGQKLEDSKLIQCKYAFSGYTLIRGWGAKLQAGQYYLSASMNIPTIAQKIVSGQIIEKENDVKVTIPEGYSLKKIDQRLAEADLIEQGELVYFDIRQLDLTKYNFEIPYLEGYLFPDTYFFSKEASLENYLYKMLDNFSQKVDQDLRDDIKKQNKTLNQILTMASLIEKEVRNDDDRKIVAGIFWQRLADNYPLQACSTIAYVLNIDKWRYSIEDTKVDSAYNTYQNIGLPPTPICNPGMKAIDAAAYPVKTDYYFFLSDSEGRTIYAETLDEHNKNIVKYLE